MFKFWGYGCKDIQQIQKRYLPTKSLEIISLFSQPESQEKASFTRIGLVM